MSDRHLKVKNQIGTYEVMWCVKHQDLGQKWNDGGLGCCWEVVVEASGDHDPGDLVPLLSAFPARGPLVEHE